MPSFRERRTLLLASLLTLPLAGCATLTPQSEVPVSAKAIAESIGNMRTRAGDTCETKQEAAALNSKLDTIKFGKEVVYKADCASASKPPKTS